MTHRGTTEPSDETGEADGVVAPSSSQTAPLESAVEQNRKWIDINKIYRTADTNEPFAFVVLDDRAGRKQDRGNYTMADDSDDVATLPADTFATIREQCLHAEQLLLEGRDKAAYRESFLQLNEALEMLPEPREQWNAGGWILSRLGEIYFRTGSYEESLTVFDDLMWFPGTIGNPWLHMRKGQVLLEVEEKKAASNELMRAYMGGGKEIFQQEDPKYYQYLKTQAEGLER